MNKSVTNEYGTFEYQPTSLEEFVEEFAKKYGVGLSELNPFLAASGAPYLVRTGERKTDKKFDSNRHVILIYSRFSSNESLPYIYADSLIRESAGILVPKYKKRFMGYSPHDYKGVIFEFSKDKKAVTIHVSEVVNVSMQQRVERNFHGSSPRVSHYQNPFGDMQNAFAFVRNYLLEENESYIMNTLQKCCGYIKNYLSR